jgi:hypothetical protein
MIFWKLFNQNHLKMCLSLRGRGGFSRVELHAIRGRCPAVVECDMLKKVDWILGADCTASSVTR